jgi:hypothetical protein
MVRAARWSVAAAALGLSAVPARGGIESGEYAGSDTWMYLSRFVFLPQGGQLKFTMDFPDTALHNPALMLYYKADASGGVNTEFGVWDTVYGSDFMCEERARIANEKGGMYAPMRQTGSVVPYTSKSGEARVLATLEAGMYSSRARWLFITVGNCAAHCSAGMFCSNSLSFSWTLTMTNGEGTDRHFSADKMWLRETAIAMTVLYLVLLPFALYTRHLLLREAKYHCSVQLLVASIFLSGFSSAISSIALGRFASSGVEQPWLNNLAVVIGLAAQFAILLMAILVAKGWTIVRRKISATGRVKIATYMTVYVVASIACWVYYLEFSDPAAIVYIYSTAPGSLLVALRCLAFLWLTYAVRVTLRTYQQKRGFYRKFWFLMGAWILSLPLLVGINRIIDEWMRAKLLTLIELLSTFVCQAVLIVMYCPLSFCGINSNFPFHATTNVFMQKYRSGPQALKRGGGGLDETQGSNSFEEAHLLHAFQISSQMRHSVVMLQSYTNDLHTFLDTIRQQGRPSMDRPIAKQIDIESGPAAPVAMTATAATAATAEAGSWPLKSPRSTIVVPTASATALLSKPELAQSRAADALSAATSGGEPRPELAAPLKQQALMTEAAQSGRSTPTPRTIDTGAAAGAGAARVASTAAASASDMQPRADEPTLPPKRRTPKAAVAGDEATPRSQAGTVVIARATSFSFEGENDEAAEQVVKEPALPSRRRTPKAAELARSNSLRSTVEVARSASFESNSSEQASDHAAELTREQTDAAVLPADGPIKTRKKKKVRAEPDATTDASATLDVDAAVAAATAAAASAPTDAGDEKPLRRKSSLRRKSDKKSDIEAALEADADL